MEKSKTTQHHPQGLPRKIRNDSNTFLAQTLSKLATGGKFISLIENSATTRDDINPNGEKRTELLSNLEQQEQGEQVCLTSCIWHKILAKVEGKTRNEPCPTWKETDLIYTTEDMTIIEKSIPLQQLTFGWLVAY